MIEFWKLRGEQGGRKIKKGESLHFSRVKFKKMGEEEKEI